MATKEMTKAERRAAIKAAKKAEKEAKKQEQAQTQAPAQEKTETETPAEETKQETKKDAAKTATVATKTVTSDKKEDNKPSEAQKLAPKDKKKPKEEKTPTIIPEEVDNTKKEIDHAKAMAGIPLGSSSSSLDGKAMLAFVMNDRYGKNEELRKRYPELYNDLNRSIDVVTLLALVDVRQELIDRKESGQLRLTVDADQILPLQGMAAMLGIELSPVKALPGNEKQLEIDFKDSKVPEELAKDAGKQVEEVPELDPKKIQSEDEVKDAIRYLLRSEKNAATALVNTVEWYRTLRITQEENADKKLTMDEMSVQDWMNEIFSLVNPVSLIKGLGRALYLYTSKHGSPVFAHSLLHHYISKVGWSEEQIASVLKALINENFRLKLKDDENAKPEEDKALVAIIGNLGTDYINDLFNNANIDFTGVDADKKNELEDIQKEAKKVLGAVRTNYFPKDHVPTQEELRMCIGQIINLYRDPANRLAEYCQNSITSPEVGEYPEKGEKKN